MARKRRTKVVRVKAHIRKAKSGKKVRVKSHRRGPRSKKAAPSPGMGSGGGGY